MSETSGKSSPDLEYWDKSELRGFFFPPVSWKAFFYSESFYCFRGVIFFSLKSCMKVLDCEVGRRCARQGGSRSGAAVLNSECA